MNYYVITRCRGAISVEAMYKHRDSAERRADNITGYETCAVHASDETELDKVIQEFRDEEIDRL